MIGADGTSQGDRMHPALSDDYVVPFELDFKSLLVLMEELAGSVLLPGSQSTWQELLHESPALIAAQILDFRFPRSTDEFEYALGQGVDEAAAYVRGVIDKVTRWRRVMRVLLSPEQVELLGSEDSFEQLRKHYEIGDDIQGYEVRRLYENVLGHITALQKLAAPFLQQVIKSGANDPSVALVLAFLQLFQDVGAHANQFKARHTDFYYRDLLGGRERLSRQITAFVCMLPKGDIESVLVPEETRLHVGKNTNRELVTCSTTHELVVNTARITDLYTLNFERNRQISPECELGYITQIRRHCLALEPQVIHEVPDMPAFGHFGMDQNTDQREDCAVGFALATNDLVSASRKRRVCLTLRLTSQFEAEDDVQSALDAMLMPRFSPEDQQGLDHATESELIELHKQAEKERILRRFLAQHQFGDALHQLRALEENMRNRLAAADDPLLAVIAAAKGDVSSLYRDLLTAWVVEAADLDTFYDRLGKYLTPYFLGRESWLTVTSLSVLRNRWSELVGLGRQSGELSIDVFTEMRSVSDYNPVARLLMSDVESDADFVLDFYTLFREAFRLAVTTEDGWQELADLQIEPRRKADGVVLELSGSAGGNIASFTGYDPQIHGDGWSTDKPIIRVLLNQGADVFTYSALSSLVLQELQLECTFEDVDQVLASTRNGPVDVSNGFPIFGSTPRLGSHLELSVPETTSKHLTQLAYEIEFEELKIELSRINEYFGPYDLDLQSSDFKADLERHNDLGWQVVRTGLALFEGETRKPQTLCVEVECDEHAGRLSNVDKSPELFDSSDVKLVLRSPPSAFGHDLYMPKVQEKALQNARRRWRGHLATPDEPLPVSVAGIKASYVAGLILPFDARAFQARDTDHQFFQIHPFGVKELSHRDVADRIHLLPRYEQDGYLVVGFESIHPPQNIDIYFELDELQANSDQPIESQVSFEYLTATGWRRLPQALRVLDSTAGFRRPGVVSLRLPEDIDAQTRDMPQGKFWLRFGVSGDLSGFGNIRRVATQAVEVRQDAEAGSGWPEQPRWVLADKIPGVLETRQLGNVFEDKHAETPQMFKMRMSERLRHRERATSVWDYERLLLDEFPDLHKVKGLRGMELNEADAQGGRVLLVAVAKDVQPDALGDEGFPSFSAVRLRQMEEYLSQVASKHAQVKVVNPIVEYLQVRCAVKFKRHYRYGEYRSQLNQLINAYFWPWFPQNRQVQFGWMVRLGEVKTFIQQLDFVDYVTDFSMLRLTEERQDYFALEDSATTPYSHVKASYHGSIAVPMRQHFFMPIEATKPNEPTPVGINDLTLNRTFVIAAKGQEHV